MVERRLLTPRFVNAARPPANGERWIADTKVRGFGLRLWRVRGVPGKAFCLRCVDTEGKAVRRTFGPRRGSSSKLGASLDEARSWARDERDRLKGRLTIEQESRINRSRMEAAFSKLTLRQLADAKLRGMEALGRSEDYRTRCDNIFYQCVPPRLREKRLANLKPHELARCLKKLDATPGKARVLRAFIGQVLKGAQEFHHGAWRTLRETQRLYSPNYESRLLYGGLPAHNEEMFRALFTRLSVEKAQPLQALFVRLLFEFDVPYERLLRAQWHQIDGICWYPWSKNERRFAWGHRRRIEPWTHLKLQQLRSKTAEFAPDSPYLFPSLLSRTGHMRVFGSYWARIARELRMHKHPLKKWVRSYHHYVLLPLSMKENASQFARLIWAEMSNGTNDEVRYPEFLWL